MSQETIYLLNGPVIGFIDTSLQKVDVTPLVVTMPASWNEPRTRVRIRFIGDFNLSTPGDIFFRKLWLGKTQLTFCATQAIMPNEGRAWNDEYLFCLYGDNLHAIHSVHHTGLGPTTVFTGLDGNSANTDQNRSAVPAVTEISRSDAPLIIDSNWNNFSVSFYGISQAGKIGFSIREFSVEKISL